MVLGGALVTWFSCYSLHDIVVCPRDSASFQMDVFSLTLNAFGVGTSARACV